MTAVIEGQLNIFDWMEDFDPAKEAKQAAGRPEQIEEPEVGQWVYKTGAPIPKIMRRSYIGKKVLMDKSTQSQRCYKVGILDWMEDFDPAKEAKQAAGRPEQIEEPEVGQWVYKTGAPIPKIMRRSYIGKKVLMDKSTQSQRCYKVGILEDAFLGQYWNGEEYVACEMSIVRDETKQRNQINHTLGDQIYECLPWHAYQKREESIFGPVRSPCGRRCKYEWGSKQCFESRGQIYDYHERKWLRDEEGRPVIGKKTCDWEPGKGK